MNMHSASPGEGTGDASYFSRSILRVPPPAEVSRPHLVARIDAAMAGKLALITAPAGWGKTSLAAEWAAAATLPVAWINLDRGDQDPARMLRLLAVATETVKAGTMSDVLPMLRAAYFTAADGVAEQLVAAWDQVPGELAIVLDDVRFDDESGLIDLFDRLVRLLPGNVHLVLTTRAEFPLPIARLRMRGDVHEIRVDDLRFSLDEASKLLTAAFGEAPPDALVERAVQVTEGWVAGLRLATLVAGSVNRLPEVLQSLTGDHRAVAEYITEEIFAQQPREIQDALTRLSILDAFSRPLAAAVIGEAAANRLFAHLDRESSFVMPVPGGVRMHAMYREYLHDRLANAAAVDRTALHRAAGAWLEGEGKFAPALDHYALANAEDDLARVLQRLAGIAELGAEDVGRFLRYSARLSTECVSCFPDVLEFQARLLTLAGRLDEARGVATAMRALATRTVNPDEARILQARTLAIESRIGSYSSDCLHTVSTAEEALSLLGNDQDGLRGDLYVSLAFIARGAGEWAQAERHFQTGIRLGRASGNLQVTQWGVRYLGWVWIDLGRLSDAWTLVNDEFERIEGQGDASDVLRAALLVSRAEMLYIRDQRDLASANLAEGLAIARAAGDAKILMNGYVVASALASAEGRAEEAMESILRAHRLLGGEQEAARHAALLLESGNLTAARAWADASGLSLDDPFLPDRGADEQNTFARVAFATGERGRAIALLERVLEATTSEGRVKRAIEVGSRLAAMYAAGGDDVRALARLTDAVRLAAPERYVRSVIDTGADLQPLLREMLRTAELLPSERAFGLSLARALATAPAGDAARQLGPTEPLTERQLQILQLLAAGRSNREIAAELFVAEGTVKAHVHQLYGKLMARSRTEAVANATSFGILRS